MTELTHRHLLLVEDETLIALAQQRNLEEYGYRVTIASSGKQALDILDTKPAIDLVLMDIDLGTGMDGTETAIAILSEKTIPIIFLSSHTEREIVRKTENITSYGYVVKSSGITVLDAAIKMAFRLFEANRSIEQKSEELETSNMALRERSDEVTRWQNLLEYIVYHDTHSVAVLDRNLVFLYVSKRFSDDYPSKGGLVGRHHYDAIPEVPEKWRSIHQRALHGETLSADFDTFPRADGQIDYVSWECRPWYESDGSVGGIVLYTAIITDRVTNERQFRLLANNMTDLVYRYDLSPAPKFSYVSPAATKMTGYTPEDHYADPGLGMKLVHPDDAPRLAAIAADPESIENPLVVRWIRRDGEVIWTEQSNTPIYDQDGNVVAIEGIARDVTERQKTQEELERSNRRYRMLVERSPDIIYLFGTKSGGIFWSEAAQRILGYRTRDILDDPFLWNQSIHPDDQQRVSSAIEGAIAGDPFEIEYRIRTKSGDWVWLRDQLIDRTEEDGEIIIQGHAEDITQQKAAEQQLLDYQWRLESIIDGTQVATWEWNVQTGEVIFDENWAKIVGHTLEELQPVTISTWQRFAVEDDLAKSNELLAKHFAGELPYYDTEARMHHKDGHVVWVRDRGKVASWTDDGKPLIMFGTHADITADKKREQVLFDQKQYLEKILETTSDGFWIISPDRRITEANPAYCKMSGYSKEELATMQINDLDDLEKPEESSERMMRIMTHGAETFETKHRRKDGTVFDVEVSATRLVRDDGAYLVCFGRDITERIRKDQQLKDTEEFNQALFDQVLTGIYVMDQTGKFIIVNEEACKQSGYSRDELLEMSIFDLNIQGAETRMNEDETLFESWSKEVPGNQHVFQATHLHKDGTSYPVLISARAIHHRQGIAFASAVIDISEWAKAQEQIETLATENETLFHELRHRIKNNLATMTSLLSLQSQMLKEPVAIAAVQDARNRLNSLGVLYDHLYRKGNQEEGSLRDYLHQLVRSEVQLFPRGDEVIVHAEIEECMFSANTLSTLGLIVNELVTNAMKYAFGDHPSPKLTVSGSRRGENYVLSVEDNGPGIVESEAEKPSSGLGSTIVHALVDQLDGTIHIESNNGAHVTLVFPITDES